MTEISTNEVNSVSNSDLKTAEADNSDDLGDKHQQLYNFISSHLSLIQIHPKEETVLKIINYSKFYKKFS